MRLLVHYLRPDRGLIRIDGMDLTDHTQRLRRRIGYLPETTPLYPEMVVLDYVKMCGRLRGLRGSALHQAIRHMVDLCDLEAFLHKPISTLSKGFRQRTGLAQAMIHNPDILILDEPTTGLDPNQIREILDLIRRLGEKKTLLLSTHILHHVPNTCDRVLVLAEGCLVFDGTPDALASGDQDRTRCFLGVDQPESEVAVLANELGFISKHTLLKQSGPHYFYVLEGVKKNEHVDRIHQALQTRKWSVCQLTREPPSLERAFRRLTHGKKRDPHMTQPTKNRSNPARKPPCA
jgi:ABC-2 type transport system ATP-binding protein